MVSKKIDINVLRMAVRAGGITWRKHVLERMLHRGLKRSQIIEVIINGECIKEYYDDKPFPSGLFLGFLEGKPIHVVASVNETEEEAFIITAYTPTLDIFKNDFKTRRI
jgi:hypothetical protein